MPRPRARGLAVGAFPAEASGARQRAVMATYFKGAPAQEAAAERLGLPFSTFRRHLATGVERMCQLLWQLELKGTEPPTVAPPPVP